MASSIRPLSLATLVLVLMPGVVGARQETLPAASATAIAEGRALLDALRPMPPAARAAFFRNPANAPKRDALMAVLIADQSLTASTREWQELHEVLDALLEWGTATDGPDHPVTNGWRALQATMYRVHENDYCRALQYSKAALASARRAGSGGPVLLALVNVADDADHCGQSKESDDALREARDAGDPSSDVTVVHKLYDVLARRAVAAGHPEAVHAYARELDAAAGRRPAERDSAALRFTEALLESRASGGERRFDEALNQLARARQLGDDLTAGSKSPNDFDTSMVRLSILSEAMALVVRASLDLGYDDAVRLLTRIGREFHRPGDVADLRQFADDTIAMRMRAAGKYEELLRRFHDNADAAERAGDPLGQASALWQLGLIYSGLNKESEANDYFSRALDLARKASDAALKTLSLTSLGPASTYLTMLTAQIDMKIEDGDLDAAERELGNMRATFGRVPDAMRELFLSAWATDFELDGARIAAERGDVASVASMLKVVESENAPKGGVRPSVAFELESIRALAYEKAGQPAEAIAHLKRAVEMAALAGSRRMEISLNRRLFKICLQSGPSDLAEQAATRNLALARQFVLPQSEWRARFDLGRIYEQQGDLKGAEAGYRAAVATLEALRSTLTASDHRAAVLENAEVEELYGRLLQLLLRQGRGGEAFEVAERDKARTFLETIGVAANRAAAAAPDRGASPLLKQQWALREQIAVLDAELQRAGEASASSPERSAVPIGALEDRLASAKKQFAELVDQIKLRDPREASLVTVAPAPLKDIQQRLDRSTAVLEYFIVPGGVVLFQMTRAGFDAALEAIDGAKLRASIAEFRGAMSQPGAGNLPKWKQTGDALRNVVLAKLNEEVRAARHWIVIPHGLLHLVPIGALPADADGTRVLLDEHDIRYLPSASLLQFGEPAEAVHRLDRPLFVALGRLRVPPLQPLPATRAEVELASREFREPTVLLEAAATKANVYREAAGRPLIHFATHGVMDYENPLFSGLILAPDQARGASATELTLSEVMERPFRADVVTLSACQTALSHVGLNDELMNLSRAFLLSGARHVVASLWSVDDQSTAILMGHFYRGLVGGASPAEALRAAEVELRKSRPDPFLWAPFLLVSVN